MKSSTDTSYKTQMTIESTHVSATECTMTLSKWGLCAMLEERDRVEIPGLAKYGQCQHNFPRTVETVQIYSKSDQFSADFILKIFNLILFVTFYTFNNSFNQHTMLFSWWIVHVNCYTKYIIRHISTLITVIKHGTNCKRNELCNNGKGNWNLFLQATK